MLKSKLTDNLIVNHKVQMENTAQREQILHGSLSLFLQKPEHTEFLRIRFANRMQRVQRTCLLNTTVSFFFFIYLFVYVNTVFLYFYLSHCL